MKKCRHQVSDDCENWTEEDLTFGTAKMWESGKLIDVAEPTCRPYFTELTAALDAKGRTAVRR